MGKTFKLFFTMGHGYVYEGRNNTNAKLRKMTLREFYETQVLPQPDVSNGTLRNRREALAHWEKLTENVATATQRESAAVSPSRASGRINVIRLSPAVLAARGTARHRRTS